MVKLIHWPDAAKVDRIIPKERLYVEAGVSASLKQRFVEEVQRVRWAYKLGEEPLRLAAGKTVTEIQVFVVDLKGSSLDNSVLMSIDKSIPSQIIFELRREDGLWAEQAMTAPYKRTAGKTKGTEYFRSGWIGADEPRASLPTALDMDGLYAQLLGRLLPYPVRANEELSDAIDRMAQICRLRSEVSTLEKRVHVEAQFNRRVELRNELRTKQAGIDELTKNDNQTPAIQRNAAWRS